MALLPQRFSRAEGRAQPHEGGAVAPPNGDWFMAGWPKAG